jgi:ribokinase
MSPPIIAVVGGINMDLVIEAEQMPDPGESMDGTSLARYAGGKGANTAMATYRAGHVKPKENSAINGGQEDDDIRVCRNGAVGGDEFGTELLAQLAQNGVNVSGVQKIENE